MSRYQATTRTLHQTLLYRSVMSALEWDHDLATVPNCFCLEPHQRYWLWR